MEEVPRGEVPTEEVPTEGESREMSTPGESVGFTDDAGRLEGTSEDASFVGDGFLGDVRTFGVIFATMKRDFGRLGIFK